MEKTHDSLQIHDNFYFGLKIYFIYFSVLKLEKCERKLLKNSERERK